MRTATAWMSLRFFVPVASDKNVLNTWVRAPVEPVALKRDDAKPGTASQRGVFYRDRMRTTEGNKDPPAVRRDVDQIRRRVVAVLVSVPVLIDERLSLTHAEPRTRETDRAHVRVGLLLERGPRIIHDLAQIEHLRIIPGAIELVQEPTRRRNRHAVRVTTAGELGPAGQIQSLLFVKLHNRGLVGGRVGIRAVRIGQRQAVHDEDRIVRTGSTRRGAGIEVHEAPAFDTTAAGSADHGIGVFRNNRHRFRRDVDHEHATPAECDIRVLIGTAGHRTNHNVVRSARALLQGTAWRTGRLVVAVFSADTTSRQGRIGHRRLSGEVPSADQVEGGRLVERESVCRLIVVDAFQKFAPRFAMISLLPSGVQNDMWLDGADPFGPVVRKSALASFAA